MGVASHAAHKCLLLDVPDLYLPVERAHAEMAASLTPRHRRHSVPLSKIDQLRHAGCVSVPDEDCLTKSERKSVLLGPVNEVEVEVIAQVGCIEHSERHWSNLSDLIDQEVRVTGRWAAKELCATCEVV